MAFITLYYTQAARRRKADLDSSSSTASSPAPSRPRRSGGSAITTSTSSASVQRGPAWPDDRRHSLKLTVKAPPSKLREVMRANEVDTLKDTLGGGQVLDGPRSSRRAALAARSNTRNNQRPAYAEFDESELDAEEEEDEEEDEEEEEVVEEDDAMNDFDALGAEAEGGTDDEDDQDDEDVDMEDAALPPPKRHAPPTAPKITLKPPGRKSDGKQSSKSKVVVTPANVGAVKSVEDQEMEDDPDDEEVEASSDLTDEDGEDEDDETNANVNDEDAEAEEDEVEVEVEETTLAVEDEELDEDEEDEDSLDDSDGTPASGSATPDLAKMTKRQRGRAEDQNTLMALDMAPQQRKFFTDEEKAMKKDEHARKRKELTKRKVQEEKTAALNRLLKPQVSKTRGAAPKPETLAAAAAAIGTPYEEEEVAPRAHPLYTRWVNTKEGIKLGVPEEWLGKNVGRYFEASLQPSKGALVQEVE
ncbi:hypothetical protein LTR99_003771 [Exophiala xenobiotica]|uniref:INO80 complex subunit B-like conserved region domain-containing protein n=1 Tax=Vermiconidia calcicola TaxID=1690605 RepID=A0AAV9PXH9_9PEZI|nr:hypothetical protein H2202_007499 [Exophiala xenobiotica]KAK5531464.1 hypothetical protein LTR25_008573 [Vermiconidia calcicola]KAK5544749.1 hypothetical protein LTR23_004189 [Chaetothyriales sp. CCFEE 6169]KAK5191403.1 hypothetical protein LTR92_008574 [Exophiala xenobiotica]KAK5218225.1 hypothetical protein LTR72_008826 [Exophiala xenobiotica]